VIAGRNEERGEALAKEIIAGGGKAAFVRLDVVKQQDWEAAVKRIKDSYGSLHILVNIVGSNELCMVPYVDVKKWNEIFETNVTSVVIGVQACAQLMKDSGGGSIVNIGSVAGITGNFSSAYSASKWALEGLSRSIAYTLADWGIRCNVIQPGFIETDLTSGMLSNPLMKKNVAKTFSDTILLRRAGKATEIANAVLFLASDESSYITATDIVVDGGWQSVSAYLGNERQNNMLGMLQKKEGLGQFIAHFKK
jgi:Dehydrogenases with different specificities (related to short-chain alcohol dehydrogenases)